MALAAGRRLARGPRVERSLPPEHRRGPAAPRPPGRGRQPARVEVLRQAAAAAHPERPADARTLATLAMVDQPAVRDVLAGAELREAARFAMSLVDELGRIDQRICRLVELGFPELERAYDDPTCVSALAVLRSAPTAPAAARKRTATLAQAARPGGGRRIGAKKAEQI